MSDFLTGLKHFKVVLSNLLSYKNTQTDKIEQSCPGRVPGHQIFARRAAVTRAAL